VVPHTSWKAYSPSLSWEIPLLLRNPKVYCRAHNIPTVDCTLSHMNPVLSVLSISFNIQCLSICVFVFQLLSCFQILWLKCCMHLSSVSCVLQAQPNWWLYHYNNICWRSYSIRVFSFRHGWFNDTVCNTDVVHFRILTDLFLGLFYNTVSNAELVYFRTRQYD
jgi:hypothetical protein